MFSFIAGLALAVNLGPMAPDAPAREPQMAANGSTVALAFGAGKGIYFSTSTRCGQNFLRAREGRGSGDRPADASSRAADRIRGPAGS